MKKIILFAIAAVLASCGKSAPSAGPADAVIAMYNALQTQDSAKYVQSLTQEKREEFQINPGSIQYLFDQWKGRHPTVKILSVKQSGDTLAYVLYDLTITGTNPQTQDSILRRVRFENGEWRAGY